MNDLEFFKSVSVPRGQVCIHWFGQLSVGLKDTAGTTVLIDPYFPHQRAPDQFIHPEPPLEEDSLPTDFVLLTHDHGDHTCPETLSRIHTAFPDCRFVGTRASCHHLEAEGIPGTQVQSITAEEDVQLGSMHVHAVFAKPPRALPEDNIRAPDTEHLGYVIEASDVRVYVSGDPINTFPRYDELVDPILALRPDIGILVNHPTEGEFPFFRESAEMASRIGLEAAVPAHYDCFVKRTYDPKECAAPPSEPDVRISRIRLSSQHFAPFRRLISFSRALLRLKSPRFSK